MSAWIYILIFSLLWLQFQGEPSQIFDQAWITEKSAALDILRPQVVQPTRDVPSSISCPGSTSPLTAAVPSSGSSHHRSSAMTDVVPSSMISRSRPGSIGLLSAAVLSPANPHSLENPPSPTVVVPMKNFTRDWSDSEEKEIVPHVSFVPIVSSDEDDDFVVIYWTWNFCCFLSWSTIIAPKEPSPNFWANSISI